MPRALEKDDYHAHALIYALIAAYRRPGQELDLQEIQKMMDRYIRELKRREVSVPVMYKHAVLNAYDEVEEAIIQAVRRDEVSLKMTGKRVRIHSNFCVWIERVGDIQPHEITQVREAAQVTITKFKDRLLHDDLAQAPPAA